MNPVLFRPGQGFPWPGFLHSSESEVTMIGKLWALLCRIMLVAACCGVVSGLVVMGLRFPHVGIVGLFGLLLMGRGGVRVSTNYGSAEIASILEMQRRGMLGRSEGLILGRTLPDWISKRSALLGLILPTVASDTACRTFLAAFVSRWWLQGQLIRITDYVHLATFAPAGAGKGVSALIINLLCYAGSCIVLDPKAEMAFLTGKFRKRKFRQHVIYLNPFNVRGLGSGSWNPMDAIIHTAEDFLDQVRDLANMLVVRTGKEMERHWNDSCELVLMAIIAFVCACEPDKSKRNFQTVRGILSSRNRFLNAVTVMQQQTDICQGVIARLGGQLTWFEGKELASVLTTVQRVTNFLDSPLIARHTSTSSFDAKILRQRKSWFGRSRATIYLILPADKLSSLQLLNRLWIGSLMRAITQGPPTEKNPVIWFLDEYAHVGDVPAITDAVTLLRGMGMRLWFFFQSREQVNTCFGEKAATVLDNIGTQQYFGITSFETSEYLSKRIGDQTVAIRTRSWSGSTSTSTNTSVREAGGSISRSSSDTVNSSEIARKLLTPDEILRLSKDLCLIFHGNAPVAVAKKVVSYRDREFQRGRCGRQGGLGLASGIAAAALLAASFMFTRVASSVAALPPLRPSGQAAFGQSAPGYGRFPARPLRRHR
jgi:type IV secretion system protein VirD4